MQKPSLGWQSWSPPTPNLFHLPQWDYSPITANSSLLLQLSHQPKLPITLWCSWHANGTKINESLILDQATKFRSHKYVPEYILIDDGWCIWGDWVTPSPTKFPHRLKNVCKNLAILKYKTGLWLAPFLVDPKSIIAKTHPDWLLKNPNGTFFNGFMSYPFINDLTPKYLLDFTNPKVMEYLLHCLDIILSDWGVTLLKLDHLYAPYFAPNPKIAMKAGVALVSLFQYIHTKYPDVYTIACGCPFEPAQNNIDSIRISKDINSPQLNHIFPLNKLLYLKRRNLLDQKLQVAKSMQPLPFGIDPDAAVNPADAITHHKLWQSGQIQVFGLGYNL